MVITNMLISLLNECLCECDHNALGCLALCALELEAFTLEIIYLLIFFNFRCWIYISQKVVSSKIIDAIYYKVDK